MITLLISAILLIASVLGFRFAFKNSNKDKAKNNLNNELSRSEVLNVKSDYLNVNGSL